MISQKNRGGGPDALYMSYTSTMPLVQVAFWTHIQKPRVWNVQILQLRVKKKCVTSGMFCAHISMCKPKISGSFAWNFWFSRKIWQIYQISSQRLICMIILKPMEPLSVAKVCFQKRNRTLIQKSYESTAP